MKSAYKSVYSLAIFLIFLCQTSSALFSLDIGCSIRNDFYAIDLSGDPYFGDILTTEITLSHSTDKWKGYSSFDFFFENSKQTDYTNTTEFIIKSSYLRYYGNFGHVSLGKNYINFGINGIFNPFEIDKNIQLNEINYEKEGILNSSFYINIGNNSAIKGYLSPGDDTLQLGISASSSIEKLDAGIVFIHNETNNNKAGVFLKGDILVNLSVSAAIHFDDKLKNNFIEATSKVDYSFKNVYMGLIWYYNQKGATSPNEYATINIPDVYLAARNYLFAQISFTQSEFASFSLYHFQNLEDRSGILTGEINYLISNGLKASLQISTAIGKIDTEFSSENLGYISTLVRVEGKF